MDLDPAVRISLWSGHLQNSLGVKAQHRQPDSSPCQMFTECGKSTVWEHMGVLCHAPALFLMCSVNWSELGLCEYNTCAESQSSVCLPET